VKKKINDETIKLLHPSTPTPWKEMAPGCTVGRRQAVGRECDAKSGQSCGCTFDSCHQPKHYCRAADQINDKGVLWWRWPLSAG